MANFIKTDKGFVNLDRVVRVSDSAIEVRGWFGSRYPIYDVDEEMLGTISEDDYYRLYDAHEPTLPVAAGVSSVVCAEFDEEANEWRVDGAPMPIIAIKPSNDNYPYMTAYTADGGAVTDWGVRYPGSYAVALLIHATGRVMAGDDGEYPDVNAWLVALKDNNLARHYRERADKQRQAEVS